MKIIAKNKSAHFNYKISEKYEAGIVLAGWEVKSIRAGNVNLKNAFASFKDNELFLSNMHIALYMSVKGEETQPRKLLMKRSQLNRLNLKQKQNGYAIIPTIIYWNEKSLIKVEIALGEGKNKADKRQTIKQRDAEREIKKSLTF